MKKQLLILVWFSLSSTLALCQRCECPTEDLGMITTEKGNAIRIFRFSNKMALGVCGAREVRKGEDTIYSEFNLFQCGNIKPLDQWDGTQSCSIVLVHDTLFVKEYYLLPAGPNFSLAWVPFYVYKYYFEGKTIHSSTFYRSDLKKYTSREIAKVLADYKKPVNGNYERLIEEAHKLFWAYVSGSKEAEVMLKGMEKKFGPFDGAIAEDWEDLRATYEHWKKKNRVK